MIRNIESIISKG